MIFQKAGIIFKERFFEESKFYGEVVILLFFEYLDISDMIITLCKIQFFKLYLLVSSTPCSLSLSFWRYQRFQFYLADDFLVFCCWFLQSCGSRLFSLVKCVWDAWDVRVILISSHSTWCNLCLLLVVIFFSNYFQLESDYVLQVFFSFLFFFNFFLHNADYGSLEPWTCVFRIHKAIEDFWPVVSFLSTHGIYFILSEVRSLGFLSYFIFAYLCFLLMVWVGWKACEFKMKLQA